MHFTGTGTVDDAPRSAIAVEGIELLPGRAAFLPASRSLLVADLHLGKAATFRRAGIPVPEGSSRGDLRRLAALLGATDARRLLILGDLLHAAAGCTPAVIAEFRALRDTFPGVLFHLVLGNHDGAAGRHREALGLDACSERLDEPPHHFVHAADGGVDTRTAGLTVAGHVHPRVVLRSAAGDRLAERCFHLDAGILTLPAFGSFTGGSTIGVTPASRAWIAGDQAVVEVTRLLDPRGG